MAKKANNTNKKRNTAQASKATTIAAPAAVAAPKPTGTPAVTVPPTGTGTPRVAKVQANRPTQNGVTAPSAGGMCAAVWEQCSTLHAQGTPPTAALLRSWAQLTGHNESNAAQELYRWAKFNGLQPRALRAQAAQMAAQAAGIAKS